MAQYDAIYILLLRALAAGLVLAVAIGLCRGRIARNIRVSGLLTGLSALGYLTFGSGVFSLAVEPFYGATYIAGVLSFGVVGFAWLFALAVLDDRKISPATLAPGLGLTVLPLAGEAAYQHQSLLDNIWLAAGAALSLHCLYVAAKGWRGDLVEARRRLRLPLVAAIAAANLYILWNLSAGLGLFRFDRIEALNALIEFGLVLAIGSVLLEGRGAVLAAPPKPGTDRAAEADRRALEKLAVVMEEQQAWRREGLSIGVLAAEIGVGEQRLRRLINGRLGHRNFASFVNAYRIEGAKQRLADPAEAGKTVAEIAFDHGFTSLGPFNRAFKELVGETPSEWRKRLLA